MSDIKSLKEFRQLYRASFMPPFTVISELSKRGCVDFGMGGAISWEPFEITMEDYDILRKELALKLIQSSDIPAWVIDYKTWDIFQYELVEGVPAQRHYELQTQENNLIQLKEHLEAEGIIGVEYEKCLIDLLNASEELSKFFIFHVQSK